MLKALVGLASIAIIAFVGYYFYNEWSRDTAVREAAANECTVLAFNYGRARAGENLGFRFSQGEAQSGIRKCLQDGLLSNTIVRGLGL